MPTVFSHAIAALALGCATTPQPMPARYWVLVATCAGIPDADVAGLRFGIPYEHVLGHRGLSHSLFFALVVGIAVPMLCFRRPRWRHHRIRLIVVFFLVTASHGVLDALTNGGLGVAFFAPFDATRYFAPFRPIAVSPLSPSAFLSQRGLDVLINEILWIWLPSVFLLVSAALVRRSGRPHETN